MLQSQPFRFGEAARSPRLQPRLQSEWMMHQGDQPEARAFRTRERWHGAIGESIDNDQACVRKSRELAPRIAPRWNCCTQPRACCMSAM